MAQPTALNDQITDSVTQTNVKVVAEAPATALASIYQSLAHSTAILYEGAVNAFQQATIAGQAATNQGVIQIYSISSMAGAVATGRLAQSDGADSLLALIDSERVASRGR
ncbi:Killing trait domain-containing protein [Tistlia consotensis]|uniref:Killing trait domain-containing protein n=1 Tax=Tistlia consotensis USBA 355 TaxID=560819 RepID=A0A1Y6BLW1_9PROT|nr:RebB family R body protein [Tistlia consotensis]SMF10001.1 Killing trait domain-containing protein [Tistlia consotensis USBA 355]SNR34085.1 Killing trait domain-containing protein [Tistlia consotensis]